ncbi:MAG: IS1182 family transposase [Candidatus Dormibacteraeota bacterium]|nr:IS1182 family transposase [Candidatus Dormibacteraeota bacterium]
MMGSKEVEPKLYYSFSLDAAVPTNHVVRRLAAAVDLGFVRPLVAKYYSHTGQPSVDPVVLFKLWMLGYLFNIRSERRLCEEAGLNLAWRWFLGYELDEPIPDHSVLTKSRRRFGVQVYERFFQRIVEVCEQRGLVEGDVLYLDSTLSDANAARDTLRSRAIAEPRLPEPAQYVRDLFLVNDPTPEPEPPRDKGGTGPKPSSHKVKPALRRSLVSTTDPDAEVQTRHNGRSRLVYKTQVLVDGGRANIITAISVGAAGDSDASSVAVMLDKHAKTLRRPARELVGDSGYCSEAAIRECVARQVVPTLNYRRRANATGGFPKEAFLFDAERDLYICPAGLEMHRVAENFSLGNTRYGPRFGSCAKCALKPQCCPGSQRDRKIDRSWGADVVDQAHERITTRIGRARLRRRQIVSERMMAELKTKHGFERAQFRRRASVQIQALLTAAVVNLKQLMKRSDEAQSGWAVWMEALATACHLARPWPAALQGKQPAW